MKTYRKKSIFIISFKFIYLFLLIFSSLNNSSLKGQVGEEWVRRFTNTTDADDTSYAILVDNSGNVFVTGKVFRTEANNGDALFYDYTTVKYDANGDNRIVATYNYNNDEQGDATSICIDVNGNGNVYVTGRSLNPNSSFDYATLKYNSSLQQQWVTRYNGLGNGEDAALSVAVDANGNVYVTGRSVGDNNNQSYDIATIKYNSSGLQQW